MGRLRRIGVTLLIVFSLGNLFSQEQTIEVLEECVEFTDKNPEFPGGKTAMDSFLMKNLRYPQEALEFGEQGIVYVQFIVEKDGSLTDIQIIKGISSELDNEAKRLIQSMPPWSPGETSGEKIRTKVRLPVKFILR